MRHSPSVDAETGRADDDLPAVRTTPWRFRRRGLRDLGAWPFRVGICATLAVVTAVASLQLRGALDPPRWGVIALVAIAVLPWLVDLLVAIVPPWAFAPTVIVPVAILHDPTAYDPLPFLLAILALDMGLQLGLVRSAPIVVGGAAIVTWQVLSLPAGSGRMLQGLPASIVAGWAIGLALHSQVRRVARLRQAHRTVAEEAAAAERDRAHRDVDRRLRYRLEAVLAELAALRAELERGEGPVPVERLAAAERRARECLADLDAQVGTAAAQPSRADRVTQR